MALPDSGAQTEFGTVTNAGGLGIGLWRADLRAWSNELKETGGTSLFAMGQRIAIRAMAVRGQVSQRACTFGRRPHNPASG